MPIIDYCGGPTFNNVIDASDYEISEGMRPNAFLCQEVLRHIQHQWDKASAGIQAKQAQSADLGRRIEAAQLKLAA